MDGLILYRMANITGTTISVSTVAKPKPAMMVIAIEPKNASNTKGIMPKIVVSAAIDTGRTRLIALSTTAKYGSLPVCSSLLIWSSSTIPFFKIMPLKLSKPRKAVKLNGILVPNRPIETPMIESGTVNQITSGLRTELNKSMVIINISK
ncbi:hypothetical protein MED222_06455 [Vibrio sp. MED222]|nr:hypothetical protein MED222_06455 [Vibrio sp. MED222]